MEYFDEVRQKSGAFNGEWRTNADELHFTPVQMSIITQHWQER